ncbi:MAG: hypothetical protein ABIF71_13430 [Planctomycetota bacterium]
MLIRMGIDEAGYGPTLGPLVTVTTAWECAEGADPWDIVARLAAPGQRAPRIADSKRVFSSRKGLAPLEASAGAVLAARFGRLPATMAELVQGVTGRPWTEVFGGSPWFSGADLPLPVVAAGPFGPAQDITAWMTARIVDAPRFNALIASGLNKSDLLFNEVCSMLHATAAAFPGRELQVTVDRLGGRDYYRLVLIEQFPGWRIAIVEERSSVSTYDLQGPEGAMRVSFRVKADAHEFAVAAASLVAKYLRELTMHLFNRHFAGLCAGLAPTQGYPVDAQRFLAGIAPVVSAADLANLVRTR